MSTKQQTCCIITRTFYKLEFIKREKFIHNIYKIMQML
jgi:hypothetical protein